MAKDFNWDDFEEVKEEPKTEGFNWDNFEEVKIEDPGMLRSAQGGVEQGITLNSADEIRGIIEALGQSVGLKGLSASDFSKLGVTTPLALDPNKGISDAYTEARDQARQEYEQLQEVNPGSYLAGNIAGGAIVPAGVIGSASKAATTSGKIAQGIKTGMTAGAITGFGGAEGDVEKQLRETAISSGVGGVIGGVIPLATEGIKNLLVKPISKVGVVEDVVEAAKRGSKGEVLYSAEGRKEASKILREKAGDFIGDVTTLKNKIGSEMGEELKSLESNGINIDLSEPVATLQTKLQSLTENNAPEVARSAKRVLRTLTNYIEDSIPNANKIEMTPTMAQEFRESMRLYTPMGDAPQPQKVTAPLLEGVGGITDTLKESSQKFSGLNDAYSSVKKVLERFKITGKEMPEQIRDKVQQIVANMEKETLTGDRASQIVDDSLGYLKQISPDLVEKHGKELKNAARRLELSSAIVKGGETISILGTPRSLATGTANVLGLGAEKVKKSPGQFARTVTDISGKLIGMKPEQLNVTSEILGRMTDESAQKLGRMLKNLVTENEKTRKGAVFAIMQNPNYRELLQDLDNEFSDSLGNEE